MKPIKELTRVYSKNPFRYIGTLEPTPGTIFLSIDSNDTHYTSRKYIYKQKEINATRTF